MRPDLLQPKGTMARGRRHVIADDDEDGMIPTQASPSGQRGFRRNGRGTQDVADASQRNDLAVDEEAERQHRQTRHAAPEEDDGEEGLFSRLTQHMAEEQVDEESEGEDDESKWADRATIIQEEAPLDPESVAVVLGEQNKQWAKLQQFVVDCSRLLGNAAAFSEEHARLEGLPQSEHFETLDGFARKLSDVVIKSKQRKRALERLAILVSRNEISDNLAGAYRDAVATLDQDYDASTSRQKYAAEGNDVYSYFRTLAWVRLVNPLACAPDSDCSCAQDASHLETEPMPALKELIPAETGDENDSDDDLQMGGVVVSFKCPLTQDYFADPVKNPECRHVFSKTAIAGHLRTSRSERCPVSGCQATIRPNELVDDPLMARRTAMHLRRLKAGSSSVNTAAELID